MLDPDEKARLAELEKRIAEAKGVKEPSNTSQAHSQAEIGWRMVTELVSGLIIGCAIGYGLDVLFGTMPIFLVVFTLFGFAAGIKVMLRSGSEFQKRSEMSDSGKSGQS